MEPFFLMTLDFSLDTQNKRTLLISFFFFIIFAFVFTSLRIVINSVFRETESSQWDFFEVIESYWSEHFNYYNYNDLKPNQVFEVWLLI